MQLPAIGRRTQSDSKTLSCGKKNQKKAAIRSKREERGQSFVACCCCFAPKTAPFSQCCALHTFTAKRTQNSRRTTTLCIEHATKRKKSNTEKLHMLAAPGTNDKPHPGQQITAAPSTPARRPPTTAVANLDGLPDRRRRRRSYLRERRRRRHLSVWETQHIRPLPQCLPSAEQASILMYYTAAVSKETQAGHVTA